MPQLQTLQPTPIIKQHSTCATCPMFEDFQDSRDRGLCKAFDEITRKHHRATATCTTAIQSLKQSTSCTVKVQLITEAVEDDGYGYPVPVDDCIIDLVVAHPSIELIEKAIATRQNLQGYRIVDFWQPQGNFEI
jgi:hypothetical protein